MASEQPSGASERRNPAIIRTSIHASGAAANVPASPHTPQRPISTSNFSSPGNYRSEEEYAVFEFGTRYLRAGLAGEASPRATIEYGPSESRRVGDFREWLPGYRPPDPARKSTAHWGKEYELWQLDTRGEDVGLVEDKLERAIRDAYNTYLLLDPKSRRVAAVLPTVLPTAYIEKILSVFYRDFQVPGISLFASPVMAVVGAGMRSGLVVDLGWNETVATAVYELRQVDSLRSTRSCKLATLHMARLLSRHGRDAYSGDLDEPLPSDGDDERLPVSFSDAEEALMRMAWCQSAVAASERRGSRPGPGGRQISGSWPADTANEPPSSPEVSRKTPQNVEDIPFGSFCLPVESAFFANSKPETRLDDHEQPIPDLIYRAMTTLPPDVRGTCVSRIVFTGGGSNIPGLRSRLLAEVAKLINRNGFDQVRGAAADKHRAHLAEISSNRRKVAQEEASRTRYPPNSAGLPAGETPSPIPAGLVMPEIHPIDQKLARDTTKQSSKGIKGIVRAVDSLGAWAGASLVVSSKVKAVVDVNPEEFMSLGISSAVSAKATEPIIGRPKSFTAGRESKSWTLGAWS